MNTNTRKLVLSAFFLALGLVLPFVTMQVPAIGRMLCPMHIPVLLCGFFCGPVFGMLVGFITPLLRGVLFGMPILMPTGLGMAFELCAYGGFAALFYKILPCKKPFIYIALVLSMIAGRIVYGIASFFIFQLAGAEWSIPIIFTSTIVNAIPGIILQLVIIPPLVIVLKRQDIVQEM